MFVDLNQAAAGGEPAGVATPARWSVVIPFFNERDYLADTIATLARQTRPFELLLVDNGSSDGSAGIALAAARAHGLTARLIVERRPGKVAALQAGLAAVRTRSVATCDADTAYPAHYLACAERLLDRPGCVAAGAYFVAPAAPRWAEVVEAAKIVGAGALMPRLCHAGGAGQCFDVRTLRAAGGFDPARWNYVLEDHEVFHRLLGHGAMRYARELWCVPSTRDRDRPSIRWTLTERLLYAAAAVGAGDWFFYRFLGPRLARRRLSSEKMREVTRDHDWTALRAAPHPLR